MLLLVNSAAGLLSEKMSITRLCCVFLLVNLLTGIPKGCTETISKSVCLDESIQLFQNVSLTNRTIVVNQIFGDESRQIAMWFTKDSTIHSSIDKRLERILFLDTYGTIWMRNVLHSDEGRYSLVSADDFSAEYLSEVELSVLVAPSIHCKPRIASEGNYLIALLNVTCCGSPAASAYWLGFSNQSVITVQPGKEAGPYHACIHGPSLRCAIGFKATDYCSSFRRGSDEELQPKISLEKTNVPDSSITLQCQANGKSAGMFRWIRNGIIITNNAKYSPIDKNLIIRHLNNDDKYDIFTCLESGGRFESDPYSIETSGPSVIRVIPSITVVKEMDTLNVSCLTDCYPLCSVTWSKLDPTSDHNNVLSKNEALQLTTVTRKMSGNITCKVQNLITGTSIEGSLSLNIHYGPDKIILNTSNNIIELDEFNSIAILCTAECFPPCVIKWTELNGNKQIEDAELKLINVSANVTYTCHAWNPSIDTRKMSQTISIAVKLVSGAGNTSKYVCPGDSVKAFQNIDFDRCNAFVSLHINGKRNTEIATWSLQNCTLNATLLKEYKDRVFLDQNGTITIHNFHHFDKGKYVVISKKDTLPSIKEVQINAMVAPSKDCKPMIKPLGNKLFASLKPDDCGTPVATPYWKGYDGVPDTNEPMLKITPGNESRTYYACIQGPALQCARSQTPLDNCSPFIIEGNTSQTMSSESSNTVVLMAVIIVLVTLMILAIVAIVILILKRRRTSLNGEHTAGLLDATCPGEKHFDDVNAEHAKILQLCDKDFENLRTPSNDQQQRLETRSDLDYEMNEVGTDHHSDIDPEQF